MKLLRLLFLLSLFAIFGRAESDSGVLRFESEGFNINGDGFNIKRSDIGSVAGQSPVAVLYLTPTGGFAPNVNVLIQNFPGSINDYVSVTKKEFDSAGIQVVNEQTVSPNEWKVEYAGTLSGRSLHWYARAVKNGDKVFLTTATATPEQWEQVSTKLKQCVDSFVLTNVPQPAA
ncbi:MAG TPA: hypothetical protein VHS80_04940 [Chthoniobacterales bacterium]|nr:hypothetical protein [Chthoniobacterales bacterium]